MTLSAWPRVHNTLKCKKTQNFYCLLFTMMCCMSGLSNEYMMMMMMMMSAVRSALFQQQPIFFLFNCARIMRRYFYWHTVYIDAGCVLYIQGGSFQSSYLLKHANIAIAKCSVSCYCFLLVIIITKVKGRHLYTATDMNMTSSSLQCKVSYWPAVTLGGTAQVAAAHCPNQRTLDPAVCSQTDPPMPQPAALWPSPRNVLWQRLTIFSSEYC